MLSIPEWVNLPTMEDFIIAGKLIIIIFTVFVAYCLIYSNIYVPWQEKKERQLHPPPPPPPKKWTDKELYELRQENSWGKLQETTGLTMGQLRYRIQRYRKRKLANFKERY